MIFKENIIQPKQDVGHNEKCKMTFISCEFLEHLFIIIFFYQTVLLSWFCADILWVDCLVWKWCKFQQGQLLLLIQRKSYSSDLASGLGIFIWSSLVRRYSDSEQVFGTIMIWTLIPIKTNVRWLKHHQTNFFSCSSRIFVGLKCLHFAASCLNFQSNTPSVMLDASVLWQK